MRGFELLRHPPPIVPVPARRDSLWHAHAHAPALFTSEFRMRPFYARRFLSRGRELFLKLGLGLRVVGIPSVVLADWWMSQFSELFFPVDHFAYLHYRIPHVAIDEWECFSLLFSEIHHRWDKLLTLTSFWDYRTISKSVTSNGWAYGAAGLPWVKKYFPMVSKETRKSEFYKCCLNIHVFLFWRLFAILIVQQSERRLIH